MALLTPATPADRDDATTFVGRVARWDPTELVRLEAAHDGVVLWARAAFGVLATRTISGSLDAPRTTAYAIELLGGLAVATDTTVDTGADVSADWHAMIPGPDGWRDIATVAVPTLRARLADGTAVAQELSDAEQRRHPKPSTKATVSPRLLDEVAVTVTDGDEPLPIPLRLLFGLSGMGLLDNPHRDFVAVSATSTWLRLSTDEGSVIRRRMLAVAPRG